MKIGLPIVLFLLAGCTSPAPEQAPDDSDVKISYTVSSMFPVTAHTPSGEPVDGYNQLKLLSKDGRYWIETSNMFKPETGGCTRRLDVPTADRVVAVWRRAAPLLNRIQHDTDPATSPIEDASFYLFDGYHIDDIRGEAPPYEFDTIEEMIGGLYHYCRRKSWTAKRAIEKPLEILEKQAVVFDKQAANK